MNGSNSIWYQLGLDNSQLQRDADKSSKIFRGIGNTVDSEGARIDNIVKRLTSGIATLGVSFSAGALVKQIATITGEFQQLGIAFETMLGSKTKADALMSQMVETAAKTLFDLKGVAQGAKQLLAYGTASEEVNDTLIRLGNIASGLSIPLNDLVYLYGTTQVQGRLFTNDLNQFMGRGIPLVKELSKVLNTTEQNVKELVSAGKVGFPEVQKVIENMTNQGGMFFNLMEKQSASLTGQIANLEDAWDMMLNDIGSKSQGLFSGAIDVAASLIENYEKVGEILLGLVATYGAYKGAVITLSVIEKARTALMTAQIASTSTLTTVQAAQIVITKQLSAARAALNATMIANPYVLAATAAVALGYTLWTLHDATTTQEKAQKRLNEINEEAKQKKEDLENQTSSLIGVINSETKTYFDQLNAFGKLQNIYPNILKNMDILTFKAKSQTEQQKLLNEALNEMETINRNKQIASDQKEILDIEKKIAEVKTKNNVLTQGGASSSLEKLNERKKILESNVTELKKQSAEAENLQKQAKLMAMSESDRQKELQKQLYSLYNQRNEIGNIITNSKNLGTPFEKFDIILQNNIARLKDINTQISSIQKSLVLDPTIKNKSYWDKQKKEATEALEAMTPSDKNSEAWKKQVALIKEANKNLKTWDVSDNTSSSTKTIDTAQNRIDAQKWFNSKLKEIGNEQLKFELDLEERLLNIQDDSFEKKQKQNALNYKKELLSIKEFEEQKRNEQEEVAKQSYIIKNGSDKGFDFTKYDTSTLPDGLRPQDVKTQIQALKDASVAIWKNADSEALKENRKYVEDLLSNYQDYTAKRLTAEKKYNEDVTKLNAELAKEPNNEAIKSAIIEAEKELKKAISGINLEEFQDSIDWSSVFGNLDNLSTKGLKDVRNKLRDYLREAGSSLSATDLQTVTDAMEKMNLEMSNRQPFIELQNSYKAYKEAILEVFNAKQKLNNLEKGTAEYTQATKELANAESKRRQTLVSMSQSANNLGNKGSQLVNSGYEIIDMLSEFGVSIDESVSKTLDGISQVFSGLSNMDLTKPFSIVTSSVSMLTGLGKTVASAFGIFNDNNRYEEMLEEYKALNDVWDRLIDKKNKYISISYGEEARKAGEEALDLINKQIEASQNLGKEYLNSGAKWNSSSKGVKQRKNMSSEGWDQLNKWASNNNISDSLYQSIKGGRMTGLFDLSAAQLDKLQSEAPVFWAKLNDETKEYLQTIIDSGDQIENINTALKEQWTQISFDSAFDSFVDTLSDMESSSEDFANNFASMLQKAILTSMVAKNYQDRLNKWYDNFANANSDDNIDLDEYKKLQDEYNSIVNDAIAERDKLKNLMNWQSEESSREATAKGLATASQDSINELNGRFTVIQSHTYNINENTIILRNNSTKILDHLAKIESNTAHLATIREDVSKIQEDINSMNIHGIILKK